MENIYTNANSSFTTANGKTVNCKSIFDAIEKSVEIKGGRHVGLLEEDQLKDVKQDAIKKALEKLDTFDPSKSRPQTWAGTIGRNTLNDAVDSRVRRLGRPTPLEYRTPEGEEYITPKVELAAGGCAADREIESKEACQIIENAIASLTDSYRRIILLAMRGKQPKQIAKILGCTPADARTLLCRARKALKEKLGREFLADYGYAA